MVLEQVKAEISGSVCHQDFTKGIRLITGASGGMLGATAFVIKLYNPNLFPIRDNGIIDALWTDSLKTVAHYAALVDLPSIFDHRRQGDDRGRALEATWDFLDHYTFGCLKEAELAGRLPRFVFSPMMVEDGRRLIISNLDMSFLTGMRTTSKPAARSPGPRPGPRPSRSAIEFRELFPAATDTFPVRTAVRMNASFHMCPPRLASRRTPPGHSSMPVITITSG